MIATATHHLILSFGLILLLLSGGSCQEDLAAPPAYVLVEGFNLETPGLEGSRGAISEVWVFAGNEYLGAFPLPARIPVYLVGQTELRFQPGVRRNGISAQPDLYEFYVAPVRRLELAPEQTFDLGVLTTGYRDEVRFGFVEDFELDTERIFTTALEGQGSLQPDEECVLSGERSGRLVLGADDTTLALAARVPLSDLFANRPYVWLEVDVKSDAAVVWGVVGTDGLGETVRAFDPGSRPTEEWTKIYFDLTEVIAEASVDELRVFFTTAIPTGETTAEVYLDNVRLLYF